MIFTPTELAGVMLITPERVLRALEAKKEPRREGKWVIFDEDTSVRTVAAEGSRFRQFVEA